MLLVKRREFLLGLTEYYLKLPARYVWKLFTDLIPCFQVSRLEYCRCELDFSDHKPVFAMFNVKVLPIYLYENLTVCCSY
jgi:hypothetical protein